MTTEAHADAIPTDAPDEEVDFEALDNELRRKGGDDEGEDDSDPDAAFLENLTKDKPKAEEKPEAVKSAEAKAEAELPVAADDALVDVKVGEESHRVKVADLKRLFGQEAALTRKGQEIASAHTEAKTQIERATAVVTRALEKAEANYASYKDLDLWDLSRKMEPAAFKQLREDGQAALSDLQALQAEATALRGEGTKVDQAAHQRAAREAVADLTNAKSPNHIEGWSDTLYEGLMTFAESKGLKSARTIVDPAVVKLLHMAHLYQSGVKLAGEKVTKVASQPAKPMRPGSSSQETREARKPQDTAMDRLRRSGKSADAEDAFLARLRPRD